MNYYVSIQRDEARGGQWVCVQLHKKCCVYILYIIHFFYVSLTFYFFYNVSSHSKSRYTPYILGRRYSLTPVSSITRRVLTHGTRRERRARGYWSSREKRKAQEGPGAIGVYNDTWCHHVVASRITGDCHPTSPAAAVNPPPPPPRSPQNAFLNRRRPHVHPKMRRGTITQIRCFV